MLSGPISKATAQRASKTSREADFAAIPRARRTTTSATTSRSSQLLPVPGGPFTEINGPNPAPVRRIPATAPCCAR